MTADAARAAGLTSTMVFPSGNIAPQGSVVKATAIDPSIVGADQVYRHRGPARVFVSETDAIAAIKGHGGQGVVPVAADDVVVLIGAGPLGTGMEETYQLTSALKFIPWGKTRAGRDRRALLGRVDRRVHRPRRPGGAGGRPDRQARRRRHHRDRDRPRVARGARRPGRGGRTRADRRGRGEAARARARRIPGLRAHAKLPDDTRLWAALQQASGGTWGGCVYDVDRIIEVVAAGVEALEQSKK